jgi:hypothetical protein
MQRRASGLNAVLGGLVDNLVVKSAPPPSGDHLHLPDLMPAALSSASAFRLPWLCSRQKLAQFPPGIRPTVMHASVL